MAAGTVTPTPTKTPTPTPTGTSCNPTYGQGGTCETTIITLDKKVGHPQIATFVDNLGVNDPKFGAESTVTFRLTVANTGTASVSGVLIKDTLPSYVTYLNGGSYDSTNRVVTFNIGGLSAGESKSVDLQVKTVKATDLPNDQGITCVTNQAQAILNDRTASDNAQFCIEKSVLSTKGGTIVYPTPGAKTTPPTGPAALALAGLIPAGFAGFILRRKSI